MGIQTEDTHGRKSMSKYSQNKIPKMSSKKAIIVKVLLCCQKKWVWTDIEDKQNKTPSMLKFNKVDWW